MGDYVLRIKSNELTLNSTATSVGNASLVRIVNTLAAASVVTQTSNAAVQIANLTMLPSSEIFLQKTPTDTLTATANVLAISVSFRD